VNSYALTVAAAADLRQITRHTIKQWGTEQAERYIGSLHLTFQNLAMHPETGRAVSERQGYLRIESGSHAVFYRKQERGILIVRVLHQKMEPMRHLSGPQEGV
jgi:toxin ParE1/3/4